MQAERGKTSAVLKFIVKSWFKAGYGGLFIATRIGDAETIKKWAEESGRGDDVVIFDKNSPYSLSFLEFGDDDTASKADKVIRVHELISNYESMAGSSKNEESFWKQAFKTMLVHCIDLIDLSGAKLEMKNIRRIAFDAFTAEDVLRYFNIIETFQSSQSIVERDQAFEELVSWREENFFLDCFLKANEREDLNESEQQRMQNEGDYWLRQLPKLAEKTRSIIVEILVSVCRPFETSDILGIGNFQAV